MPTPPGPDLDVGALLDRVEGIAPIEAVQAAAEALTEMLDARELTFLIADFSGRAVVRLTTGAAGAEGAERGPEHQGGGVAGHQPRQHQHGVAVTAARSREQRPGSREGSDVESGPRRLGEERGS